MKLTFYLFTESVKDFPQALNPQKLAGDDAFEEIPLKGELPFEAKAYFQKNRETTPKWLSFLSEYCEIDESEVVNTTNSFLLLIRVKSRVFAITTGFGFTAIERNHLEPGFGLKVTLNEINPSKIKGVDVRRIDTITRQKRVLINHDSPIHDFEFDLDEDLVHLIAGQPKDEALARKLAGSDSLSLTSDVTFPELGQKCTALLSSFMKEDYKADFGFIDHMRLVKSPDLKRTLDGLLVKALENRNSPKLMLAYPEIDGWNEIEHFKFRYRGIDGYAQEVTLHSVYQFTDEHGFDGIDSSKFAIIGLNHDQIPVTKKFSLYDYLVFECDYDKGKYLFSLNRWFELAKGYVEEVNKSLETIQDISSTNILIPMLPKQREDEYNLAAAEANPNMVCLDKKNFSLPGQSRIEACDLLTQNAEFICVKKYNRSSTLSHLFSQGLVSAMLLNDHQKYREFILKQCPQTWKPPFSANGEQKKNIAFVFAIAAGKSGVLPGILPFFSKVNLRHCRRSIERMGYRVMVYKIPYTDS